MRLLLAIIVTFGLSACVFPSIEYSETPWRDFVAGCRNGSAEQLADKPYFLITSRLPDCRENPVSLTVQRADNIRYGRFSKPEMFKPQKGKEHMRDQLAFQTEAAWWQSLASEARKHDGKVLIYVHGYNETFASTSEDAIDIATYTGFPGPVVHYSWPSRGELLGYTIDENNSDFEQEYFSAVVSNIARLSAVKEIVLVSHSMGARLAVPAIEYLDQTAPATVRSKLTNIILASPDYDAGLFFRKLQYTLLNSKKAPRSRKITVYTSRKDVAVNLSRSLHGYARLGNPKCDDPVAERNRPASENPPRCYPQLPPKLKGFALVDTTSVSDSNNGHNDFLRSKPGCADFAHVIKAGDSWPGRKNVAGTPDYVWQLSGEADTSACRKALGD